jgi:hypothetical protein
MLYKTRSQIICTWHKAEEDKPLFFRVTFLKSKDFWLSLKTYISITVLKVLQLIIIIIVIIIL